MFMFPYLFLTGDGYMLSNIGVPGLIIIFIIALILFGPNKLPELGRAFGQTLKEFKKSTREHFQNLKMRRKRNKRQRNKTRNSLLLINNAIHLRSI